MIYNPKISLAAALISAFSCAAAAQDYSSRETINPEMIGPFPAHHECVRQVVKKNLGEDVHFYNYNYGVSGAWSNATGFKEIMVNMQGAYVSSVGITIAEDMIEVKGLPPYAGIMSSNVQYHPRRGGTIETTINGKQTVGNADDLLRKVDIELRECNWVG